MGLLDRRPPMMKRDVPYEETTQGMTGLLGRAFYPDGYSGGLLGMEPWASKAARYAEAHRGQAPSAPSADQLMSALEVMPGMDPSNLAAGMMGKIVYHGTPHQWLPERGYPKGRPRLDKIGTGEGAQAYGHGFYSADSPDVAKQYADDLTAMRVGAAKRALGRAGDVDGAIADARRKIDALKSLPNAGNDPARQARQIALQEEKIAELNMLKETGEMSSGKLLTLDLPDEAIDRMLDWDAPLSQQPEAVRKVLDVRVEDDARGGFEVVSNIGRPSFASGGYGATHGSGFKTRAEADEFIKGLTGQDILRTASTGSPRDRAYAAQIAGIPGVKYYDQGSRASGNGTRNYVTWDQDVLDRTGILD
jgi:hypothetical protein